MRFEGANRNCVAAGRAAVGTVAICVVLLGGSASNSWAQLDRASQQQQNHGLSESQAPASEKNGDDSSDPTAVFPHSQTSRWWISGQVNIVFQAHPSFRAKYSGPNSLRARSEHATSRVLTLYTGAQLSDKTEALFDVESVSGHGVSDALGLAGFTNLDVVRNPDLGSKPYIARVMIHKIIALSGESVESERGPLSLFTRVPARRLEFRAGKFTMVDFFDVNSVGSDSHLQFLNWTVVNNGAYDYAADTRGYTWGAVADYEDHNWGLRFAEALMPTVANGIHLEWNLRRARSENVEADFYPTLWANRHTAVRLLAFVNHGNMGVYEVAVANFLAHRSPAPDITAHPLGTAIKYGFGVNVEQNVTSNLRAFGRLGWNEGQHESFAYTEVDQTVAAGADLAGQRWERKHDKVGAAFVSNGISRAHQLYLALGGRGFLLGDGRLNYGREQIFEGYYNLHLWRGVYAAFDLQHINNPGYNRVRGPVLVPGLRLHLEL